MIWRKAALFENLAILLGGPDYSKQPRNWFDAASCLISSLVFYKIVIPPFPGLIHFTIVLIWEV